jgi:hypothetical protein
MPPTKIAAIKVRIAIILRRRLHPNFKRGKRITISMIQRFCLARLLLMF